MTQLSEREFFDEYDNLSEITRTLSKNRYRKVFEFLYHQFNHEKKSWITSKILQERLGMVDRSNAYQILESFRILNMLNKQLNKGGRAYYSPINPEYWEEANKTIIGQKTDGIYRTN